MPPSRHAKKQLSGKPSARERRTPPASRPPAASPTLEEIKKQYGISDKDYKELVELLDDTTFKDSPNPEIQPAREPRLAQAIDLPSAYLSKYLLATAAEQLNLDLSDEDRKRWEGLKSPGDVVQELVKLVSERTVIRSDRFALARQRQPENLPLTKTPGNVGAQPQPKEKPVRSLDKLEEPEMKSLSLEDFARAAQGTTDPRKLMLGLNVVSQVEEEFQKRIKQYIKDNHGVEPKGKVTLKVIINSYDSVKKGMTYHGYAQASFDGQSRILYRLNDDELAVELERRQISPPVAAPATLAR